jgi:hypothetical protein
VVDLSKRIGSVIVVNKQYKGSDVRGKKGSCIVDVYLHNIGRYSVLPDEAYDEDLPRNYQPHITINRLARILSGLDKVPILKNTLTKKQQEKICNQAICEGL